MVISPKNITISLGGILYIALTLFVISDWSNPKLFENSWHGIFWICATFTILIVTFVNLVTFLSVRGRWTKDIRKW